MDKYRQNVELVQDAIRQRCLSLQPNPNLAQRVLSAAVESGGRKDRKVSVGFAFLFALLMMSVTALATVLLTGHDVKLYEGVDIISLLPEQWQTYDVCHPLHQGYLVGGFSLDDDVISPMDDDDAIVMLDQSFHVQWSLTDERLEGCLFDKVRELGDALYLGMERVGAQWVPAIMKLDQAGHIEWLYEGKPDFIIKDFAVDVTGSVYGIGAITSDGNRQASAFQLDTDGNVVWEKSYVDLPVSTLSALRIMGNHIILAGNADQNAWIGALSADGRINWQRTIGLDAPVQTVRLQSDAENHLVLSVVFSEDDRAEATSQLRYYVLDPETLSK